MIEQVKAEAYVREKLQLEPSLAIYLGVSEPAELQLQHWLSVFGEECDITPCMYDPEDTGEAILALEVHAHCSKTMYFNLTTGQPATEADYKAFNEIVGE